MKQIVGKKIIEVQMSSNDVITFIDENYKKYSYACDGDCCSSTWISHISGIKALLDQTIREVKEREFSDLEKQQAENDGGDYEVLQVYGYDIITDKGICTLEFRNDSNGYYGGSLEFIDEDSYYPKNENITKDF